MNSREPVALRQIIRVDDVTQELTRELVDCWVSVSNAGGAVGFPFPPVDAGQVEPAAQRLVTALDPQCSRLVLATVGGLLAGWLNLRRSPDPLIAHWGTVHHVQSHPSFRGRGIGSALMNYARQIAREDMGLQQLRLEARAGVHLEEFYGRLGWKEIGRWPGALRLAPDDDRDEILMVLDPL